MPTPNHKTAILLLAYGGPDSLDDIPAYLLDIRGGRETPQRLIDEITERYAKIGGSSPLLAITSSVADKLGNQLGLPVYVGMRHWHPYIKDVVAKIAADGIEHVIALCMAPHYSTMSIGAYKKHLDEAVATLEQPLQVDFIPQWGTQEDYLDGIAANIQATLERFEPDQRADTLVVLTAHSLPAMILERGDPYADQLQETARLLAEKLNLPADRWTFSYQSAAKTGIPWLGPQIEDYLVELASKGHKNLVIAPIGFISDHVEVLYDIDIGVQEIAQSQGVRVERSPMLNDNPILITALSSLVENTLHPISKPIV